MQRCYIEIFDIGQVRMSPNEQRKNPSSRKAKADNTTRSNTNSGAQRAKNGVISTRGSSCALHTYILLTSDVLTYIWYRSVFKSLQLAASLVRELHLLLHVRLLSYSVVHAYVYYDMRDTIHRSG